MKKKSEKIKKNDYWGCLKALWIPIVVFVVFFYQIITNNLSDSFYNRYSIKITAHVNKDRHAIANSKVVNENSFTSGYEFEINGKMYYGNSREQNLPYGYPIEVEYVSFFPYWNRVKK